mmetsp:Transcript_7292/g.16352  ORF Transcript_7292/g.16352 Transcript_7292/m.16352 type:complete len:250 (+) Transcript_7292:1613-2362(+)
MGSTHSACVVGAQARKSCGVAKVAVAAPCRGREKSTRLAPRRCPHAMRNRTCGVIFHCTTAFGIARCKVPTRAVRATAIRVSMFGGATCRRVADAHGADDALVGENVPRRRSSQRGNPRRRRRGTDVKLISRAIGSHCVVSRHASRWSTRSGISREIEQAKRDRDAGEILGNVQARHAARWCGTRRTRRRGDAMERGFTRERGVAKHVGAARRARRRRRCGAHRGGIRVARRIRRRVRLCRIERHEHRR